MRTPGGKRDGAGRPEAIKFVLAVIYQGRTSAELKQGFYLLGTLPAVGSSGLSGTLRTSAAASGLSLSSSRGGGGRAWYPRLHSGEKGSYWQGAKCENLV